MGALDFLTAPLRAILGATEDTERDVVERSPLHETHELERELEHAVESIHRAADSMERHVTVLETLATSVPALTDSVNALVREMHGLLGVLAPVAEAEGEVSRLGHLFGRRHKTGGALSAETQAGATPPADSGRA